MQRLRRFSRRNIELSILVGVFAIAALSFGMVSAALQLQKGAPPLLGIDKALIAPLVVALVFLGLHLCLRLRLGRAEQIILPVTAVLFTLGLVMIWRLNGFDGVKSQLLRGFLPGAIVMAALVMRPQWIEIIRRRAILISLLGLALPALTALFGVVDETGARLALKLGPLPAIQTSEVIKVVLVIFLAWYIERQGEEVEGRARPLLFGLRLPALHYFIPGTLFVVLATLALVGMSDFGAVLILGFLFVAMLYAGFDTRVFAPVAAIGLGLAAIIAVVLVFTWEVPAVIRYRFLAFLNPWSTAMILENGQPTGITVSAGPGYQIQQAIYALVSGGVTGTGLGFGNPEFIPLGASDFIFAALVEEMGSAVGIAVILFYILLILRILRVAITLPRAQVFERLLVVGIAAHFFIQVFIMIGGTLNLLPLTGITIPLMSQGGMALLINLAEIGIVLALVPRMEAQNP